MPFKEYIYYYCSTGNYKRPVKVMAHIQIIEQIIDKTENPEEKEHPDNYPAEAAIPVNMVYQKIIEEDVVNY